MQPTAQQGSRAPRLMPAVGQTNPMKNLDLSALFKSAAEDLISARSRALAIHPTDLRAAGNEVEKAVRDYFKSTLAPKYYITHGHVIDRCRRCSPELDVIVADNQHLPSLFRARDGTDYVPAEAVFAVGEVKSRYRRSSGYESEFAAKLKIIHDEIERPEWENTMYGGVSPETLLDDMVRGSSRRIHNPIFSFMLFVDSGDFTPEHTFVAFSKEDLRHTPGVLAVLGSGVVVRGKCENDRLHLSKYPFEPQSSDHERLFFPPAAPSTGSVSGGVLGFLHAWLLEHLAESRVEVPSVSQYLSPLLLTRKSGLIWAAQPADAADQASAGS
jgi:hypothetical protein